MWIGCNCTGLNLIESQNLYYFFPISYNPCGVGITERGIWCEQLVNIIVTTIYRLKQHRAHLVAT
jgi:hypothetical protein